MADSSKPYLVTSYKEDVGDGPRLTASRSHRVDPRVEIVSRTHSRMVDARQSCEHTELHGLQLFPLQPVPCQFLE